MKLFVPAFWMPGKPMNIRESIEELTVMIWKVKQIQSIPYRLKRIRLADKGFHFERFCVIITFIGKEEPLFCPLLKLK